MKRISKITLLFLLLYTIITIASQMKLIRKFAGADKEFVIAVPPHDVHVYPSLSHYFSKMADFGGEDLFAVFDNIETKKKGKEAEVPEGNVKGSLQRILLQRGEKRVHEDTTDGAQISLDHGYDRDGGDDGEKLKRIKKPDDER